MRRIPDPGYQRKRKIYIRLARKTARSFFLENRKPATQKLKLRSRLNVREAQVSFHLQKAQGLVKLEWKHARTITKKRREDIQPKNWKFKYDCLEGCSQDFTLSNVKMLRYTGVGDGFEVKAKFLAIYICLRLKKRSTKTKCYKKLSVFKCDYRLGNFIDCSSCYCTATCNLLD